MINAKEQLNKLRLFYGTFSENECDENTSKKYEKILFEDCSYENIPENVKCEFDYTLQKTRFYSGIKSDLTENEIYELMEYKKLGLLTTIKNCIVFFTICSVIGIVLYLCSIISIL